MNVGWFQVRALFTLIILRSPDLVQKNCAHQRVYQISLKGRACYGRLAFFWADRLYTRLTRCCLCLKANKFEVVPVLSLHCKSAPTRCGSETKIQQICVGFCLMKVRCVFDNKIHHRICRLFGRLTSAVLFSS